MLKRTAILLIALGVAGCSSGDMTPYVSNPVHFNNQPPISLAVTTIDVVQDYEPKMDAVDQTMAISPASAIHTFVAERLHAAGATGYLQLNIKDASVTEKSLQPTDDSFKQMFTREQTKELDGHIKVDISADRRDKQYSAFTSIDVTQSTTVPEDATPAELGRIERKLLDEMMATFNQKAEQGIDQHMSAIVIR